jgi:hypothetical protein
MNQGVVSLFDDNLKINIDRDTVTFDYTTAMGELAVRTRAAVARYRVLGRSLTRLAPIAPSFGGFLSEWLDLSDADASRWSSPEAGAQHAKVAAQFKSQIFAFQAVAACPGPPPSREIVVQLDKPARTVAFLISGSSAEEMRMVSVLDDRPPGCKQIDISMGLSSILSQPPRRSSAK